MSVDMKLLHQSSFQSLQKVGLDWYSLVKGNRELEARYYKYLSTKAEHVLINVDASQLEVGVLASLSGDERFIAAVNSGMDIHNLNTYNIYGVKKEDLEAALKIAEATGNVEMLELTESDLSLFATRRKYIKGLTFSLSYGAGAGKIASDLRIPITQAEGLINDFYNAYPGVKRFHDETMMFAIKNGYVSTPFGRHRATPRLYGRMDAYEALVKENKTVIARLMKTGEYWKLREEGKVCKNTPVQSTATDMISKAFCIAKKHFDARPDGARCLMWIHDAIVMSSRLDTSRDNILELCQIMESTTYPGDPIKYRTECEVGYNYEYVSKIKRDILLSDEFTTEYIQKKLTESLQEDLEKKFKLIIKTTGQDLSNAEQYIDEIKEAKMAYFEAMLGKLGFESMTPFQYCAKMNGMTEAAYEEYFMKELRWSHEVSEELGEDLDDVDIDEDAD